jgi:hypothetical protein
VRHFVTTAAPGRLAVAYIVPGSDVATAVCDAPVAARGALEALAARLTRESEPAQADPAPEERRIPSGFYSDQGALW